MGWFSLSQYCIHNFMVPVFMFMSSTQSHVGIVQPSRILPRRLSAFSSSSFLLLTPHATPTKHRSTATGLMSRCRDKRDASVLSPAVMRFSLSRDIPSLWYSASFVVGSLRLAHKNALHRMMKSMPVRLSYTSSRTTHIGRRGGAISASA